MAPLWPGGYSWFNRYASLYAIVISATDIFTEASYGVSSWIVGRMLDGDTELQNDIWTLNASVCGILFIVMGLCQGVAWKCGERPGDRRSIETDNDELTVELISSNDYESNLCEGSDAEGSGSMVTLLSPNADETDQSLFNVGDSHKYSITSEEEF